MIVTCPQCAKRYMLDQALVPKEGRQVRCFACQHVWHQVLETPPPIHQLIPLKDVDLSPSSHKRSSWIGWLLTLLVISSAFAFLILGRDYVVEHLPSAEKAYKLVGLPLHSPGAGLMIAGAKSRIHLEGGDEVVQVMGDLINTSDRVRPVPPLKIKAIGAATHPKCLTSTSGTECVLKSWEHRLSENFLLPGEQIRFETDPQPQIEGTKHISVEF